jgi:hypothetical protein
VIYNLQFSDDDDGLEGGIFGEFIPNDFDHFGSPSVEGQGRRAGPWNF